jgi:GT2 family glycosyltransferase
LYSIVVPVLNNVNYTKLFFDSFEKTVNEKNEIILIDNNSSDETESFIQGKIKEEKLNIKYIKNKENVGVASSWNQGVKESSFDIICICNNDIEFLTKNWLTNLNSVIKNNKKVYYTTPRTAYTKDPKKTNYKKTHYEQLVYGKNPNTYVVGCCFMCPRICFEEIGYFDEKFEVKYYEDLDYINRILEARKSVAMCHNALVYHAVGRTSLFTKGGEENENYYNQKWGKSEFNILNKNRRLK